MLDLIFFYFFRNVWIRIYVSNNRRKFHVYTVMIKRVIKF